MTSIAVLGLGIIGGAWAKNLAEDGHDVRPWNRTPKDFPGERASVAEAVTDADFVIVVVADPPAVQSVLEQALPSLKPGAVVLQSSTISPEWTRRFADQVMAAGGLYIDAPFTGSKPAAEQRKTVYYLGGDPATIDKIRPIIERLSQTILHIGPIGAASSLKLAMNLNLAAMAQALSESLTLARREGISDEIFFEALGQNVGRSGLSDLKQPKLIAHDYAPQFSLKHMAKDLRLALETSGEHPLPQTRNLNALYERALGEGWGDDDFIGLVRLIED
ncbi:6-phosphogluconate dehydrogenase [Capsulimonas corticalis]|uniref:6-phosphogluconate dehydrogenase n=1 Tax=Capsulimonas corticalis TaxID=2219043 RepID=A0A402CS89_9BACT|nr:NAD(P)-dependent oxidoreductase [Capsulimonas corticalis]BDI28285.1 6-phosphogluconate dehydrogenase [Capsulimonas corticalis]